MNQVLHDLRAERHRRARRDGQAATHSRELVVDDPEARRGIVTAAREHHPVHDHPILRRTRPRDDADRLVVDVVHVRVAMLEDGRDVRGIDARLEAVQQGRGVVEVDGVIGRVVRRHRDVATIRCRHGIGPIGNRDSGARREIVQGVLVRAGKRHDPVVSGFRTPRIAASAREPATSPTS